MHKPLDHKSDAFAPDFFFFELCQIKIWYCSPMSIIWSNLQKESVVTLLRECCPDDELDSQIYSLRNKLAAVKNVPSFFSYFLLFQSAKIDFIRLGGNSMNCVERLVCWSRSQLLAKISMLLWLRRNTCLRNPLCIKCFKVFTQLI